MKKVWGIYLFCFSKFIQFKSGIAISLGLIFFFYLVNLKNSMRKFTLWPVSYTSQSEIPREILQYTDLEGRVLKNQSTASCVHCPKDDEWIYSHQRTHKPSVIIIKYLNYFKTLGFIWHSESNWVRFFWIIDVRHWKGFLQMN